MKTTEIVDPKVVSADHGWWLPEEPGSVEEGLYGVWDLNVNSLLKWRSGVSGLGSNYKTTICRIYPVGNDDQHNVWTSEQAYNYVSKEVGQWE